jgi:hypothetical protein
MFGLACVTERRVTFATARPTTFDVTKGGEASHFTCRFAIQSLAQHGSFVSLTDKKCGERKCCAPVWGAAMGISGRSPDEGASENTFDPDLDKESPRQAQRPSQNPMDAGQESQN